MPRFFKEFFEDAPFIDGDDARHILKSLRMRVGESLTVCDTKGFDYECVISGCTTDRVDLDIQNKTKNATEPTVFVTLYLCLTKGDKMDTAVRQAVEMGVSRIVPVLSTNCVSRPDEKQMSKKVERWQKIADEAAGQSGRGILPEVGECITLKKVAEGISSVDLCLFFYEIGGEPLSKLDENIKKVSVIIGPEGGFTRDEALMLEQSGARVTTLGPRILRAETAPVAAVTAVMLQSGNM
ncbi:MAG: 16S rRNA (uracil(1498)-N(3))-methyltransferase [Clostridia bacterium]|nr:16S rRNA (uracil(1498)-N(3))-methyltransferase [Clostridia bacterium]